MPPPPRCRAPPRPTANAVNPIGGLSLVAIRPDNLFNVALPPRPNRPGHFRVSAGLRQPDPYNPAVPEIILYVSGHGFGHAVRCAMLCRALLAATPGLTIGVRTTAPAWIFPRSVTVERSAIDVRV